MISWVTDLTDGLETGDFGQDGWTQWISGVYYAYWRLFMIKIKIGFS